MNERLGCRTPHILVVEDHPIQLRNYVLRLEHVGYEVTSTQSGQEALELASRSRPIFDAAVLDLTLNDGSALEIVQALLDRRPLCKSMVVTGTGAPDQAKALLAAGAQAWIEKPAHPRLFLSTLAATLQATLAWRRTIEQSPSSERIRDYGKITGAWKASVNRRLEFDVRSAARRLQELGRLTPAQTLTAYRMLWGDTDQQIAARLGCTHRTVRHHVQAVLRGTGAQNRTALLGVLLRDSGVSDGASDYLMGQSSSSECGSSDAGC